MNTKRRNMMQKKVQELIPFIRSFPLLEECNKTPISYLTVYHFITDIIKMPETQTPYLYFIVDGSMRLHTPSGIMNYMAGQYSISAIDTPISGHVLTFSKNMDFLALSIEFTLDEVISVVLDIDGDLAERIINSKVSNQIMANSDNHVMDAIIKLLSIINEPDQLAFMGKHMKREIIFNVLCGSCGKQFLQSMIHIQQAGDIYKSNSWIKQNFKSSFTVEELAEQRNMSVSNFHQKFKNAVGMGPLQCQKRLRITEARRLMLDENINVTDASMNVGYESVSQFIRDYKKIFHASPKEDIQNLRKQLKR